MITLLLIDAMLVTLSARVATNAMRGVLIDAHKMLRLLDYAMPFILQPLLAFMLLIFHMLPLPLMLPLLAAAICRRFTHRSRR